MQLSSRLLLCAAVAGVLGAWLAVSVRGAEPQAEPVVRLEDLE